nr:hypothetical protein [Tanacetum cinerariifolium]
LVLLIHEVACPEPNIPLRANLGVLHNEIVSLKRKVKKLEKRNRSRTYGLKRLYKVGLIARVESSADEESLDDVDKEMFDVDVLGGEEVFVAGQNENVVKEVVDAAQAKIDADHQLAKRMQAKKQEELSMEEKATLFQQLLEKRKKHFAAKRAEEKKNKPPTKAQQRKIMCTYLKNIEGYKLKDLKLKEFDRIQEIFDRAFRRVNTFEDFRTELVKGKEKRAGEELIQDNEEEVAIDAIPLAVKSLRIVNWKIHKEGKKSYYQIIYMLVEKKYPLTPPTLSMMLEKKLQIDYESEMAYQLCKLIKKQLKK